MKKYTVGHKYLQEGVGIVYNCDCDQTESKIYHNKGCKSQHNLTLEYKLSFLGTMLSYVLSSDKIVHLIHKRYGWLIS